METRRALYPLGLASQRQRLADLLGLHEDLVAEISERRRRRVLVQRAATQQPLAAEVDEVAIRQLPARLLALDVTRSAALTVERHRHHLLVLEELAILVAVERRVLIFVAVVRGEHARLARLADLHHERERAGLADIALPVRLE